MVDLYLKRLETERKALAKDTPERQRIAELDGLIAGHKATKPPREQASK